MTTRRQHACQSLQQREVEGRDSLEHVWDDEEADLSSADKHLLKLDVEGERRKVRSQVQHTHNNIITHHQG